MKLTCPRCGLKMRLPADKVPPSGAWARCPKCRERFFINPGALSLESLLGPASDSTPVAPGSQLEQQAVARQNLLARLKKERGVTEETFEPGLVTVHPQPIHSELTRRVVTGVLLCLPLLAMGLVFKAASNTEAQPGPQQTPAAVVRLNDNSSRDIIRQDLVNIRQNLAVRRPAAQGIDYSGAEVRVFKYFMGQLLPNVCSGIHHLDMKPINSNGFSAQGHCVEPDGLVLEMQVEWAGTRAVVSFPFYRQTGEMDIYPPLKSRVRKAQAQL